MNSDRWDCSWGHLFLFLIGFTIPFPCWSLAPITYGSGRGLYDVNTTPVPSETAAPEPQVDRSRHFQHGRVVRLERVAAAAACSLKSAIRIIGWHFRSPNSTPFAGAVLLGSVPVVPCQETRLFQGPRRRSEISACHVIQTGPVHEPRRKSF